MPARDQPATERVAIDWGEVARAALGSAFVAGILTGALHVLGKVLDAEDIEERRDASPETDMPDDADMEGEDQVADVDDDAQRAAAVLGVDLNASADEIRAALRARLADSQIHPDQGGDGEEAKELIAAKNLLIERARAAQS
jgi:hypothetical protein